MKAIASYASIDMIVSQRLLNKYCGHLWYLSGEAVALALFDANVSCEIKRKMANAIRIFDEEKK